ncbi:MAG: hypothetical protein U1E31_00850 [Rickettsiales bacterium]
MREKTQNKKNKNKNSVTNNILGKRNLNNNDNLYTDKPYKILKTNKYAKSLDFNALNDNLTKDSLINNSFEADIYKSYSKKKKLGIELNKQIQKRKQDTYLDDFHFNYNTKKTHEDILEKVKQPREAELQQMRQNIKIEPQQMPQNIKIEPQQMSQNSEIDLQQMRQNIKIEPQQRYQDIKIKTQQMLQHKEIELQKMRQHKEIEPQQMHQDKKIEPQQMHQDIKIKTQQTHNKEYNKQKLLKKKKVIKEIKLIQESNLKVNIQAKLHTEKVESSDHDSDYDITQKNIKKTKSDYFGRQYNLRNSLKSKQKFNLKEKEDSRDSNKPIELDKESSASDYTDLASEAIKSESQLQIPNPQLQIPKPQLQIKTQKIKKAQKIKNTKEKLELEKLIILTSNNIDQYLLTKQQTKTQQSLNTKKVLIKAYNKRKEQCKKIIIKAEEYFNSDVKKNLPNELSKHYFLGLSKYYFFGLNDTYQKINIEAIKKNFIDTFQAKIKQYRKDKTNLSLSKYIEIEFIYDELKLIINSEKKNDPEDIDTLNNKQYRLKNTKSSEFFITHLKESLTETEYELRLKKNSDKIESFYISKQEIKTAYLKKMHNILLQDRPMINNLYNLQSGEMFYKNDNEDNNLCNSQKIKYDQNLRVFNVQKDIFCIKYLRFLVNIVHIINNSKEFNSNSNILTQAEKKEFKTIYSKEVRTLKEFYQPLNEKILSNLKNTEEILNEYKELFFKEFEKQIFKIIDKIDIERDLKLSNNYFISRNYFKKIEQTYSNKLNIHKKVFEHIKNEYKTKLENIFNKCKEKEVIKEFFECFIEELSLLHLLQRKIIFSFKKAFLYKKILFCIKETNKHIPNLNLNNHIQDKNPALKDNTEVENQEPEDDTEDENQESENDTEALEDDTEDENQEPEDDTKALKDNTENKKVFVESDDDLMASEEDLLGKLNSDVFE